MSWSAGPNADFYFGGMNAAQNVKTFQRVLAFLPVGDTVPHPTASAFSPSISALYTEAQIRASDLAITAGLRYDAFNPGGDLGNATLGARSSLNPRIGVSTVLKNATFVVSVGKFSQPPDLQYHRRRVRRQHAHRPVPPGQPESRLRIGDAVRDERPGAPARAVDPQGQRLRQALSAVWSPRRRSMSIRIRASSSMPMSAK